MNEERCEVGPCLLLVEDEHDIREQLRELFEEEGFQVVEARNGLEALHCLKQGLAPAIVLMDLMMPRMNGWELLQNMRRDAQIPDVPIVVTSAMGDTQLLPRDVAFIRKPYTMEGLLDSVHAQVDAVHHDAQHTG